MYRYVKRTILLLMTFLPVSSIAFQAETALMRDPVGPSNGLRNGLSNMMSTKQFRSLFFPNKTDKVPMENAYAVYNSLFENKDPMAVEQEFYKHIDRLIDSGLIKVDSSLMMTGNESGTTHPPTQPK